jgi:hypothetical protein
MGMKLEEGQVWKQKSGVYLRIVRRERLAVEYKAMKDPRTKEGTLHEVSKKEFCRLLSGAVLLTPEQMREVKGLKPQDSDATEDHGGAEQV